MQKKIYFKDLISLSNALKTILDPFNKMINTNKLYDDILKNIKKNMKSYTKSNKNKLFMTNSTKQSDYGYIILLSFDSFEIKLFSSERDFYNEFGPLNKLNSIKQFPNIVKLLDYKSENEYQYLVQKKIISFDTVICEVLKANKDNFDFIYNIFVNLFKSFFRLIFVLYLKNNQINTKLKIENFGLDNNQPKNWKKNKSYFYFYGKDLIHSEPTSIYPKTESFIYDRRYLFKSFENLRKDLLIKINECNLDISEILIEKLKIFYEIFDLKLTDVILSDKISELGGIKYGEFKLFKFLNYDDIIKNIKEIPKILV